MRLEIERGELLKALSHVTSVVERRTTIPILSNVMLKASGETLTFKATDLEREVSESVAAKVTTPGTLTVPAHVLHDIVRKLPEGAQIEMKREGDKERLTITSGNSRFSLQTLSAEDFPDLTVGEIGHEFTMEAGDLKRLIDKTRFAISTEETRYYLNGIYLHPAESGKTKTLRAVATDGHRLAQVELPRPKGADGMPGVIVPRKTVHELTRLIEVPSGQVKVGVSQTKVRFEIGPVVLTSKLIDGTFPDYGRVIPAQQRQGNEGAERVVQKCRRSRVDDRQRTRARGEAQRFKRQADPDREQSGRRQRDGRDCGRLRRWAARDRLQCALSARYRRTARKRRCALSAWLIRARRRWSAMAETAARFTC